MPHWTAEYIPELFQSFLSADPEAARLYKALTDYRTDGELYEETIRLNTEPMTLIVVQLLDRLEAHFIKSARADFLDYQRIIAEAKLRIEAKNEQSKIPTRQN
jgi:GH25 family lysozyme M1 (1,4-beta-N-acetylmuramidase)